MKGIQGVIVALGLGMAAAMLNWYYLKQQAGDIDKVEFIGIKVDHVVSRGERLREEDLEPVGIPAGHIGRLPDFAVLWRDLPSVLNSRVYRTLPEGALLLQDDLRTPPPELKLEEGELATWIPVDTRTFVASLVEPGDLVSFRVPGTVASPTLAPQTNAFGESTNNGQSPPPGAPSGPTNLIGPFKILAIGNRLGSSRVMKAAKLPQTQENVVAISARLNGNRLDPRTEELFKHLEATNFRGMAVLLHPRIKK